ncbi:hypothetical protein IB642_01760 [Allofrancisella guangzhouensis]|uniref:FKBP-type peptidyl-prolyl cis-trans isomerase N-terminal domain-containing protein n=1 Tax=Allofrancisella guangzhouensis TaxID=594679 RepID=UPI0008524AC6|nr:FKBP-type peptidyl-prolyl cis-trans isomerase N-terminal domain-containing protein [Allofrancisella guangzhouensis]MBK2026793.1 hypothetical protein [Allofrancisella guangzhouensis]MBK2043743.1 hypothetical protein [Allofrancisella guangzhouensis]MBK2045323.1 hypothetical protein [Allofrancisella guangzhouensis]
MKLTKTLIIAPLLAGALVGSSFAADKNDISYSVGYSMGKTLQTQMTQNNITIDNQQIVNGLKDGILGKDAKLTPEQMQNAMVQFQNQAIAKQKVAADQEQKAVKSDVKASQDNVEQAQSTKDQSTDTTSVEQLAD